jgi:hypothetical protein
MVRFEVIPIAAALAKLALITSRLSIKTALLLSSQSQNDRTKQSRNRCSSVIHQIGINQLLAIRQLNLNCR